MSVADLLRHLSGRHLIDGQQVQGAGVERTPVIDPATEEVIGELTEATPTEIDTAVRVANTAQKRWNILNYHRRAELLHEAAHAMRAMAPRGNSPPRSCSGPNVRGRAVPVRVSRAR